MIWITWTTFYRSLRTYALAIISLALAVLVSCLGLSGLQLLQQATLQPLTLVGGGQVIIVDARTEFKTSSAMIYADPLDIQAFPAEQAERLVAALPGTQKTQQVLIAPITRLGNRQQVLWSYLGARENPKGTLSGLSMLSGSLAGFDEENTMIAAGHPSRVNKEGPVSYDGTQLGNWVSYSVPQLTILDDQYHWTVQEVRTIIYKVAGVYNGAKAIYGINWTELAWLQAQIGGERPISWMGIAAPLGETQELKRLLEEEIERQGYDLKILTIQDLGRMLIGDFDRFEKMADYYTPVMLFVAILIVLVNAITLTMARRKELALLRILGLSMVQVQAMFVLECFIASLIGGLTGTLIATAMALSLAGSIQVRWLPFWITLAATSIVGAVSAMVLTNGKLSNTLRNPMGE